MEDLPNGMNIFNKIVVIPSGGVLTLQDNAKHKLIVYYWDDAGLFEAVEDESWKFYGQMGDLPETDNFGQICNTVKERLVSPKLPKLLSKEIQSLFEPIGLQLCELLDIVRNFEEFDKDEFLNSLVFDYAHFIDISKSINLWIENTNDDSRRMAFFTNACYFCLESRINYIWSKMSVGRRISYFDVEMESAEGLYVNYWVHKLQQRTSEFMVRLRLYGVNHWNHWLLQDVVYHENNINWLMLRYSTLERNYIAVSYFSQMIYEAKDDHLLLCLRSVREAEESNVIQAPQFAYLTHCLYDELSYTQKIFCLYGISEYFIKLLTYYWQYQEHALAVINMFWDDMTIEFYNSIIQMMIQKAVEGRYLQENLIENIWELTPIEKKRRFFDFVISDFDSLKIFYETSLFISWRILKTATVREKNAILSAFEI